MQNRVKGVVVAVVEGGRVVEVLRDVVAGQIDAREETLGTRIGQQFCIQLPIRAGLRVAAHGTGRSSDVAAQLNLVLQQVLEALLIHRDNHGIGSLAADLEAEAAASDADEHRSAPAVGGAAGNDTLAVLGTYYESALLHARHDS